jgi:hypothetical protein
MNPRVHDDGPVMTANRDLAELARKHAADAAPGSLDRRAWGRVAVALATTGTITAASGILGAVHPPEVRDAAGKYLDHMAG